MGLENTTQKNNKQKKKLGEQGELTVQNYLLQKGYSITERNYRTPFGELDIIAENEHTMAFIEVKTRSYIQEENIKHLVSKAQIRRIVQSAMHYVSLKTEEENASNKEYRFDLALLIPVDNEYKISYFEAGLDISEMANQGIWI